MDKGKGGIEGFERVLSLKTSEGAKKLAESLWPAGLPPLAIALHLSPLGDEDLRTAVRGFSLSCCIVGNRLTGGKATAFKGDSWKKLL